MKKFWDGRHLAQPYLWCACGNLRLFIFGVLTHPGKSSVPGSINATLQVTYPRTGAITRAGSQLARPPTTKCVLGSESKELGWTCSLFGRIYGILSAQTSMLLLDHCWSARINKPVLAHMLLEVQPGVCRRHEQQTHEDVW